MKIGLEEFLELNVNELIAVNGGSSGSCSGSTGTGTGSAGVGTGAGDSPASSGSPGTTSGTSGGSGGSCSGAGGGQTKTTGGGTATASGTCSGSTQKGKDNPGGGAPAVPAGDSTAGTCGGTTPKAKDDPTGGNPGLPAGGDTAGTCSGTTSSLTHQTPDDPKDFHCDIIAYNEAIDHGIKDPGSWSGNHDNVETIYKNNYAEEGSDTAKSNTSGYVFYDCDNNGTYEHMEYYSAGAGSKYTCWTTDGIKNPVPVTYDSTVDSNGHAKTGKATFVSLN